MTERTCECPVGDGEARKPCGEMAVWGTDDLGPETVWTCDEHMRKLALFVDPIAFQRRPR